MLKSRQLGFLWTRNDQYTIEFHSETKKNCMQMLTLHDKSAEALYV